jgi:hypothetical protein
LTEAFDICTSEDVEITCGWGVNQRTPCALQPPLNPVRRTSEAIRSGKDMWNIIDPLDRDTHISEKLKEFIREWNATFGCKCY